MQMQAADPPLTKAQMSTATIWDIEGLSLPHPAVALLRSFIVEALDRGAAAAYVQSRISTPDEAYRLASDWACVVEAGKLSLASNRQCLLLALMQSIL